MRCRTRTFTWFAASAVLAGCASEPQDLLAPDGAQDTTPGATEPDASVASDGASVDDEELIGGGRWSCHLTNPFSGAPECKAYTGDSWSEETAAADCALGQYEEPGDFGTRECAVAPLMGVCDVPSFFGQEYRLVLGGSNPDFCTATARACTTFLDGEFTAASACEGAYVPPRVDGSFVFEWPTQTCVQPSDSEAPGAGPDGQVCTWNLISACTEEGRSYLEYGDCDVVRTNRPYYSVPTRPVGADDDPRHDDAEFVEESAWIRAQVESCACVCCHTDRTPDGPSMWSIDDGTLFMDSMSDTAIAMFAGYIDSSAFGAFDPAANNGFNRIDSALPTTDVERTLAFFEAEFRRREIDEDWARSQRAIGGPLVEQQAFVPEPCDSETRIDPDGSIHWPTDRLARYVYALEPGSTNPAMPPSGDLPDGTIWRIDLPHTAQPLPSGSVTWAEIPPSARQAFPDDGNAPRSLQPGEVVYLYILQDIAYPITRCLATVPEL
jgi:hypothetical protein